MASAHISYSLVEARKSEREAIRRALVEAGAARVNPGNWRYEGPLGPIMRAAITINGLLAGLPDVELNSYEFRVEAPLIAQ